MSAPTRLPSARDRPTAGWSVGDYVVQRKIGSGAYSVVYLARHSLSGTEVAVKEIALEQISEKLRRSLFFEVDILRRIRDPNIIALHDSFHLGEKLYLVLEYCKGGDLSMYIQRHGKVPEAVAKRFLKQLTTGLQVLRKHNVVHRDLKPQNILFATSESDSLLKIADFGFAKDLEPQNLAETVCGSPLYMAPEIMQGEKYDSKADIWSLGIILYQLLTGHTPFNGNNQLQLFRNIMNTNELRFPPNLKLSHDCIDLCKKLLQRSPVQRPTIEELVHHRFLLEQVPDATLSRTPSDPRDEYLYRGTQRRQSSHDDCMPFPLDDDSSGQDESPSVPESSKDARRTSYGFSVDRRAEKTTDSSPSKGLLSKYGFITKVAASNPAYSGKSQQGYKSTIGQVNIISPEEPSITDSLEFIDQEYVFVPGPNAESSSSSVSAMRPPNSSITETPALNAPSAPMPIMNAAISRQCSVGSMESHSSPVSGTSQGSVDMVDAIDQPSSNLITRIKSLQICASAIADLVKDEMVNGKHLEAFALQLVVLAIWRQALQLCNSQAPTFEGRQSVDIKTDQVEGALDPFDNLHHLDDACAQIEREFLNEFSRAEEISTCIGKISEATEMPDAVELIFQSSLQLGRHGGAKETMGKTEEAASRYYRAVSLLRFLLTEAPLLPLNPPLILSKSDRHRLRTYIEVLGSRLGQLQSQKR